MFLRRVSYIGSIFFLAMFGCSNDEPTTTEQVATIEKMKPSQASRGQQSVKGRITGNNFVGVVLVNLGEGVELLNTTIVSPTVVSITFSVRHDATPGPRSVTVTTPSGTVRNADVFRISDNAMPVAHFTVTPSQAGKNSPFSFDASDSTDSDGDIQSYDWNFGDGHTATGQTSTHSYDSAGDFEVSLTVTDDAQGKSTATHKVTVVDNKPPVAHFTALPGSGNTTTLFSFDGSDSKDEDGRIADYKWSFDDGGNAEGKKVTHQFHENGTFHVTLTVKDNGNLESSASKDIRVTGNPPVATFSVSPSSGPKTTNFKFDASGSHDPNGQITSYAWDFDDGETKTGKIVNHQFSTDGQYTVQLTVTDNDGATDSADEAIEVTGDDGGGGGAPAECPISEMKEVDDGGMKPFCNSMKLPRTSGPDHPVTVTAIHNINDHRVMDIRVYNGDHNEDYCCQSVFYLCTEFRNSSGAYVFGASAFEIGHEGKDSKGYYRDYYLYRAGKDSFGQYPPPVGSILNAHGVICQ